MKFGHTEQGGDIITHWAVYRLPTDRSKKREVYRFTNYSRAQDWWSELLVEGTCRNKWRGLELVEVRPTLIHWFKKGSTL